MPRSQPRGATPDTDAIFGWNAIRSGGTGSCRTLATAAVTPGRSPPRQLHHRSLTHRPLPGGCTQPLGAAPPGSGVTLPAPPPGGATRWDEDRARATLHHGARSLGATRPSKSVPNAAGGPPNAPKNKFCCWAQIGASSHSGGAHRRSVTSLRQGTVAQCFGAHTFPQRGRWRFQQGSRRTAPFASGQSACSLTAWAPQVTSRESRGIICPRCRPSRNPTSFRSPG